jgi:subtilisin family serine protease
VIDSGLEKSSDLGRGRADKFFDFTTGRDSGHPYDDYGHGTHVATLIAGEGKESEREVEYLANGKEPGREQRRRDSIAPLQEMPWRPQ